MRSHCVSIMIRLLGLSALEWSCFRAIGCSVLCMGSVPRRFLDVVQCCPITIDHGLAGTKKPKEVAFTGDSSRVPEAHTRLDRNTIREQIYPGIRDTCAKHCEVSFFLGCGAKLSTLLRSHGQSSRADKGRSRVATWRV